MKKPLRTFESLPENFQKKTFSLLMDKYSLQGKDAPAKRALDKIREQKPQTYRAWQRFNFFSMQGIDKALIGKGLPKKHF